MKGPMTEHTKILFLVGMMGTGKTTIGQLVAEKMNFKFIDTDDWIEKQNAMSVSEIFNSKGEIFFRSQEKAFILDQLPLRSCVVSCGGGLCIANGMMDLLKSKGTVICLWASDREIIKRISKDNLRPLLGHLDPSKQVREILQKRSNIYLSSDHVVETDGLNPSQVAHSVVDLFSSSQD